eukprot:TRINITY_DN7924_c1_g1_i1.p1 TRINITY_DN7924_c1_g1~~TRINITY_DN7924_c1_g1_i1.p1  ORF type:complete len:325 (-),score=140.10 TRINITY_DN7924_c1_g1_i1:94-1068(-)
MRLFQLSGHDRPLTQVLYNREGDLLFSAAKSAKICVWHTDNGERLGTFSGHNGVVWSLDVDDNTSRMISGSGDETLRLWDIKKGKQLDEINFGIVVKWVQFSHGSGRFLVVTDAVRGHTSKIFIYSHDNPDALNREPIGVITNSSPSFGIIQAHWGPLNKTIITANGDGSIRIYDAETLEEINMVMAHEKVVKYISFSPDQSHFVSSSPDTTAKLWETRTLNLLKTYQGARPVNAAVICPAFPHILVGGGQSAESVTTTRTDPTQFHLRLFHKVFQDEIASVPGHFGPVNCLAYSPNTTSFVSGGEDGYIRMYLLNDEYSNLGN